MTAPRGAASGAAERIGPDTLQWQAWSTSVRIVVTDPAALDRAHPMVVAQLDAVDRAASRFRADSEINRLPRAGGRPERVSPLLAELVGAALEAARRSSGDVDPTVGGAMFALGYDRDLSLIPTCGSAPRVVSRPVPGWRQVHLDGRRLTLPPATSLDLGATAKAWAADRCAHLVAAGLEVGVLVSIGGDIATAGPAPRGGWRVLVQDRPGDPACILALPAGAAVATSSTVSRQWRRGERTVHHILDPRTSLPAEPVWRTATVVAPTCLKANTLSTSALIRGHAAMPVLRRLDVAARLVTPDLAVVTTPRWPTRIATVAA